VGAGAASSYGGRRWKNTPVLERYIASVQRDGSAACTEDERPDRLTRMLDYLSLGLRLREGVALEAFAARFDADLLPMLGETGAWLVATGLLERDGSRLRVGAEHQLITNEILVRLHKPLAMNNTQARRQTSDSQIAAR
jgi:oxygen-independent coproporphyrinogen III oxidase